MANLLTIDTYIAGKKTVGDWLTIRNQLNNFNDEFLWLSVYEEYFITRLNDRYIKPIETIKTYGTYRGEGFSIMTIICSIIEFLETTYQGLTYRFVRRNDPPLNPYEYSRSEIIFISFLTRREPFKDSFTDDLAKDFYRNVRCGLLHEARTKGRWTVWGNTNTNKLIQQSEDVNIVFRDNFYNALMDYIKNRFKAEVINSPERKESFLRKFDSFCYE